MSRKGTIAIEEAVLPPDGLPWLAETAGFLAPGQEDIEKFRKHAYVPKLLDIHDQRLKQMDEEGVDFMLLSVTSPGCQGEGKPAVARDMARSMNDWLAGEVGKNTSRFGGLAAIPMHNGQDAAIELRRAVTDLGMFGAILNDFQTCADDEGGRKYFDTADYDAFWATAQELDVPVYMHPRFPAPLDTVGHSGKYSTRKHLLGASVQFHLDLSFHIYAICSGGVFDRFPGVKLVVGHLGEGIPFNLWRADHWYNKPQKKVVRGSEHDYSHYFKRNVWVTTSGFFSTDSLKFCIEKLGVERCLYSIDYPYDSIKEAQDWWKEIDLPDAQKEAIARNNVIELYKLHRVLE